MQGVGSQGLTEVEVDPVRVALELDRGGRGEHNVNDVDRTLLSPEVSLSGRTSPQGSTWPHGSGQAVWA